MCKEWSVKYTGLQEQSLVLGFEICDGSQTFRSRQIG